MCRHRHHHHQQQQQYRHFLAVMLWTQIKDLSKYFAE
jgi:hypothetical protein